MEYFFQKKYFALNSYIFISIVSKNNRQPTNLFLSIIKIIDEFEKNYSRFQANSQLTSLNHHTNQKFYISTEFMEILKEAKRLSEITKGLFNPFILPNLQQAGYVGSWPHPNYAQADINYKNENFQTIDKLEIGNNWVKIPKHSAIDLGGIGKGYLLDKISNKLLKSGYNNYWLSIGGDIIVNGHDENKQNWQIKIAEANNINNLYKIINNDTDQLLSVATSGITKRRGLNWNHIINPSTLKSVNNDILTVTVSGNKAVETDVLAKTILIDESLVDKFKSINVIHECYIQRKINDDVFLN